MPEVFDAARAAWTEHAEKLIHYEGVISVEVGRRIKGGKPTKEEVVVVRVVRKRDAADLAPDQAIPPTLTIGGSRTIGTDIVEDPAGYPTIEQDTATYRPVPGGCEIGAFGSGFLGTLGGWFCQRQDDGGWNTVWLTNAHVADPATRSQIPADARVTQPAGGGIIGNTTAVDGWPNPLPAAGVTVPGVNDAAIGRLNTDVDADITVLQIADAPFEIAAAVAEQPVQKRGRTTFRTDGTVDAVGIAVNVGAGPGLGTVTFGLPGNPPVHRVRSNAMGLGAAFGAPGDSGSLVFNGEPGRIESTFPCVGLYFAGTFRWVQSQPNPNAFTVTGLMIDIQAVMNRLNLTTVCNCVMRSLLDAIFGRGRDASSDGAVTRSETMLRAFRDKALARSSRGKAIAQAMADATPATARVLSRDPEAFEMAVELLRPWADAASGPAILARKIDDETVKRALALAERVQKATGDEKGSFAEMSKVIQAYHGKTVLSMIGRLAKPTFPRTAGQPNPKEH